MKKQYPEQTFTYFIPAPPARESGYREKNFDQMINSLLRQGFELIDLKTQSIAGKTEGMWVISRLRPLSEEAYKLDIDQYLAKFNSAPIEKNDGLQLEISEEIDQLTITPIQEEIEYSADPIKDGNE